MKRFAFEPQWCRGDTVIGLSSSLKQAETFENSTFLFAARFLFHSSRFHFLPSTMIMWYPNLVLTGGFVYCGLAIVLTGRANAASWNSPTIAPRICQPRSPPRVALSSLMAVATSGNFSPASSFCIASRIFDCFSHKMCLTLIALQPPPFLSFPVNVRLQGSNRPAKNIEFTQLYLCRRFHQLQLFHPFQSFPSHQPWRLL